MRSNTHSTTQSYTIFISGSIPPARVPTTLHWKDTKQTSSSSSSDTELCDDDNQSDSSDDLNHKSPVPDLPQDNLNNSDIPIVVEDAQNMPACEIATDNIENQQSDILKTVVNSELNVEKITDVDSEDDSVDFELFLEDRVKCLKEDGEDKRVTLSRRNSERALQIIQENSLILHRILQCQSRLSLSPPATEISNETDDESISKKPEHYDTSGDGETNSTSSNSILNTRDENQSHSSLVESHLDISDYTLPKTPQAEIEYNYSSKYEEILTKSKSLNEKCDCLFNPASKTTILEDAESKLAESKTFTNREELIDFTSDCASKENVLEVGFDENKIRPWLEKLDLNRNTEYPQYTKRMEDDLTPQQNFECDISDSSNHSADLLEKSEVSKVDQTRAVIPDMIVSCFESRKNSEIESQSSFFGENSEWTKKLLSGEKGEHESNSLFSYYDSKLDTQKFTNTADKVSERRSLSATNSVDKTDKVNDRRSLSATNSIERTLAPMSKEVEDDSSNECSLTRFRSNVKSPDIPYESSISTPPRSRLSSSNSRDLTSPLNESSTSVSSRVTSPSPERDYEIQRRFSPRKSYFTSHEDTKEFSFQNATDVKYCKSPTRTCEIMQDPRNSSEYKTYRESKDRIEKKLYGDQTERSVSPTNEIKNTYNVSSCDKSLKSPEKCSGDYSRNLNFRSSSSSPLNTFSSTEEEYMKRKVRVFDGNEEIKRVHTEEENHKLVDSTLPKLSSPDRGSYSSRSSPLLRYEERRGSISPKSPNKVFNPFPVPLSSRQNKEIGVKLGLYKK